MPDRKEPRQPTLNDESRDIRQTTAPPPGSVAARAITRGNGVPIVPRGQFDDSDANKTPVGADNYEVLAARTKRAADSSLEALSITGQLRQETNQLRHEFREDIGRVNTRIDGVVDKVGEVHTSVLSEMSNVREDVSGLSSKVSTLVDVFQKQIDQQATMQMTRTTKMIEVETAQAMLPIEAKRAEIADKVETGKVRREIWMKVIGFTFSAAGLGAVIALIASKC